MSDSLKDLQKQVKLQKERRKARYQLARKLGFSSAEATMLQGRSEDAIRKLAEQKKKQVSK